MGLDGAYYGTTSGGGELDLGTIYQLSIDPPSAPTNLVVANNAGFVSLNWTASNGALNYIIKRATSVGGPYTPIGNATNTIFEDLTVVIGIRTFIRFRRLAQGVQVLIRAP